MNLNVKSTFKTLILFFQSKSLFDIIDMKSSGSQTCLFVATATFPHTSFFSVYATRYDSFKYVWNLSWTYLWNSNKMFVFVRSQLKFVSMFPKACWTQLKYFQTKKILFFKLVFTFDREIEKKKTTNEPRHDKTNKLSVRPAKTQIQSDQSLRCALNG